MKNNFLSLAALIGVLLYLGACANKNTPTPNNTNAPTTAVSQAGETAANAGNTTTAIQPMQNVQQLVGKWAYGHEPFQVHYKADGTFEEYANMNEDGTALDFKTPSAKGTWTFANGTISTVIANEAGEKVPGNNNLTVSFMGTDWVFFGDLQSEMAGMGEYAGTEKEYIQEFGYMRLK